MTMRARQHGVALLIVLWACTLLAIMLGGFAMLSRSEGLQARYQFTQTQAHYAAEAGVMRAIDGLMAPTPELRWVADGRNYPFAFAGATVNIAITDEDGKVDLNAASGDILDAFFRGAGLPEQRAIAMSAAVQDWRSFGDQASLNGAKAPAYKAAGRAYGPRNGPFATVEELQMVLGMDPALYATVAPAVTIWSGRERPNPDHAPPLALASLPGMKADEIGAYVARRQGAGAGVAGGNGVTHSIRSEATMADGTRAILRATIRLQGSRATGQPYAVLRWQEGDGE
jgi:general secretion pathway protein K